MGSTAAMTVNVASIVGLPTSLIAKMAACKNGKALKVPVYKFLKEALIRKFGADFYEALHQVALDHFEAGKMKR